MFPRVKNTIVFRLRGRGPPIIRVLPFLCLLWFCIRASHAKMKGLRHFISYLGKYIENRFIVLFMSDLNGSVEACVVND